MLAFGTAITDPALYERVALPSIRRVAEPDSATIVRRDCALHHAYNEIMDEAAARPGLEALILLHQDLELRDERLALRVRDAFADPRAGLLGALGGRISKPHRWLAPDRAFGYAIGPGPAGLKDPRISTGPHDVDGIDGALIVVAPWVVRGIRFAEPPDGRFHGYDMDIGFRVGARGGRVICEDIPCRHHTDLTDDYDDQRAAGVGLAWRWDPSLRRPEWRAAFQS
jgi:Glycosyltransferase like family